MGVPQTMPYPPGLMVRDASLADARGAPLAFVVATLLTMRPARVRAVSFGDLMVRSALSRAAPQENAVRGVRLEP